jgi:dihydroneopterin aldolase
MEAQERRRGQAFMVDVELFLDLARAGREDRLAATVDYAEVFRLVRRTVEEERFGLLEALAEAIAQRLLAAYPVEGVLVRLKKPRAPVGGTYAYFGVEIERYRG